MQEKLKNTTCPKPLKANNFSLMLTLNFKDIDEIKKIGFIGFKTVPELWTDKSIIPRIKGVYLVINPSHENTEFISPGVGGFFKGKDPNVSILELKENHVENSQVVYIGKAGSLTGKGNLNSRIGQYLRFGKTKNVGHWGGRFIWQIKNYNELVICWKPTPNEDPREIEKQLLLSYQEQFGKRPFANLIG